MASAPAPAGAKIVTVDNHQAVELADDFDRAWRRVGLSLDRSGFTVEDRDRSKGDYFVRYLAAGATDVAKPGFFSRLFGAGEAQVNPAQYQVQVRTSGATTLVSILNAKGQPDNSADAQRITQLLANDLK